MTEAKSIETLSVSFTAGVIAGTALSSAGAALPLLLLLALSLPCLFRRRIIPMPSAPTLVLMAGTFLLLGCFCAWNSAQPGPALDGPIKRLADDAALRLRTLIGSLPFRSPDTAPLLLALLTGERSGLSTHVQDIFRASGASHLLALSGLHMGILYLVFDRATRLMGRSPSVRKLRYVLLLSAAGFFTLMTGAGPSLVRAFLFIAISETLRLLGRPRNPLRILCLALLVQLALDPAAIRSLGFQLSYLAMAGITLLYPILDSWYPAGAKWDPFRKIWSGSALGISCQAFTAPLVWLRFHSFPRFFLLTNLLALPVTTLLMVVSVGTVALSALGGCPAVLNTATDGLCRLLLWILELISAL
jgi:competence protein ComEC